MKQLLLWMMKEEVSSQIALEKSACQELIAIMAEAIVSVVQKKEEGKDERVEESQDSR